VFRIRALETFRLEHPPTVLGTTTALGHRLLLQFPASPRTPKPEASTCHPEPAKPLVLWAVRSQLPAGETPSSRVLKAPPRPVPQVSRSAEV